MNGGWISKLYTGGPGIREVGDFAASPVLLPFTEAGADANTFVCEFVGGSSANETGVGLGLAGADLVLTQAGSVPAASSGYRALNGSSMYFTSTAPFLQAFLASSEWTLAHKVKSFTVAAGKYLFSLQGTKRLNALTFDATGRFYGQYDANGTFSNLPVMNAGYTNTTDPTWFCMWKKNSILHFGFVQQDAVPTGWDSFPQGQRFAFYSPITDYNGDAWGTTRHIVGSNGGYPALSIGVVVASKIGLAAAPL